MTLSYESTLNDLAQLAIRQFSRSETARKNRLSSAFWAAFTATVFIAILFRDEPVEVNALWCFVAATVGSLIAYCIYPISTKKRIRKYVERELGKSIPALTRYTVGDDTIQCESFGATIIFRLEDLKEIAEDSEVLELSFGSKGLCVIPLRAFKNPEEKITFITKIKNANNAMHRVATRVTPPAWARSLPGTSCATGSHR
jgi:hypothetical protein